MRRRSPRPADASPSLFPFLAVLICTMGALIVLLVIVIQQSRVHASSSEPDPADAEALAAQVRQLEQQRQDDLRQLELLEQDRDNRRRQLDTDREALRQLEHETNRLAEDSSRHEQAAGQLRQQGDDARQRLAAAVARLVKLEQAIAQAKDELRRVEDQEDAGRPVYALIPYDGPNETRRQPIYLECLADRVVLQPEGITFCREDFEGLLGANNPLAVALQAARAYLARAQGTSLHGQAYPLLIVRPDGAEAYAAARAAMSSWDAEFGYELVTADMKLAYPPPDPALAEVLRGMVQLGRQRQQRAQLLAGELAGTSQGDSGPGFRASGSGGFVPVGTEDDEFQVQGGASRPGRGGMGDPPQGLTPRGAPAGGVRDEDLARATSGSPPGETPHTALGSGADSNEQFSRQQSGVANPGSSDLAGQDLAGSADARSARSSQAGDQSAPGNRSATGDGAAPREGAAPRDGSAPRERAAPREGAAPRDGSVPPNGPAPADRVAERSGRAERAGGRAADQVTGPAGSQPSGSSAASAAEGVPGGQMSVALGSTKPLAEYRGRDWALPDSTRGVIGITRPITVRCAPDRFVLEPEPGTADRARVIQLQQSTEAAIQPLVDAVWKRVDGWGIAGPGVYWKPELHVSVTPGAETRFLHLQALLQDSGIALVRKRI